MYTIKPTIGRATETQTGQTPSRDAAIGTQAFQLQHLPGPSPSCLSYTWKGYPMDLKTESLLYIYILCGASQVVLVVKDLPANARDIRDPGSIPGLGRPPGGGHGHPLQYSCLENPIDRRARRATVHRVAKRWTQLQRLSMLAHMLGITQWVFSFYTSIYSTMLSNIVPIFT